MITKNIGNKEFQFSNTLRVLYNLRDVFHVKTFEEVLTNLQHIEFEQQLEVIYTSYKAATPAQLLIDKEEFIDYFLDNMGIISTSKLSQEIVDGLIYTGASDTEREEAEKNAQKPPENQNP